ncbi:MAG: DUF6807 family protein [Bacteroidota bacterium]|nr:DUF6807 family protein [Bacteroidota bacterium]
MIRILTLITIVGFAMNSCEGQSKTTVADSTSVVFVNDSTNQKIDVKLNGTLFTRYHYNASLPKPVLFPLVTASGKTLTRGFPINPVPGERVDHPHHMGHWFNYGDVNGLDFWNNSDAIPKEKLGKYGKIVHSEIVKVNQEEGSFKTKSSWQNIAGQSLLEETTVFKFSQNGNTRIIDRSTTLTALEDTSFKDNKEGVFGVRVTRAMELPSKKPAIFVDAQGNPTELKVLDNTGVNGNYLSSEGLEGNDVWGTRAEWVKLYSTINQEPVSITILDHPNNVGYPTYWHARGYGLFSANPLGQRVFSKGRETLNFALQKGESVTFHYRMLIHNGSVLSPKDIKKFSLVNSKYKSYFNGSDLSHWIVPENNIWWIVDEKTLKIKSGPEKKGSTLWTKDKFENFRIRLKFKFGSGTVDSGIFMRGDDASNPQIQVGISGSLKRDMTGSPYVPKQGYPQEAVLAASLLSQNDWNKMEAEAIGNRYRVWLNGKQVMDYTMEDANLSGPIGIQLHANRDMEIWYKSIDIASF